MKGSGRTRLAALLLAAMTGRAAAVDVQVLYLEQAVPRPPILSVLDTAPDDLGLAGAETGLAENTATGRFLGHDYTLERVILGEDDDVVAAARTALEAGHRLIVANLPAAALLALADLPEATGALIVNGAAPDDALRREECRANLLHTLPSRAMLTDALAQFMGRKRWTDWFLITGEGPGDAEYAAALRASAAKFNAKIVEESVWRFDADMRRNAAQEAPLLTRARDYDVVVVADEIGDWARYVPYNTWLARPVAGTEGLAPVAWSPVVEQWGAAQLQRRFVRATGRGMQPVDFALWAAMRAIGEAVTRTSSADPATLRAYMLSREFELAVFKGRKATFRGWNGQMRQPIPLVHARALAGQAPVEGYLHRLSELDTLGQDEPETTCRAFR